MGYENSDKASFNNFLEQLLKDAEITDLVLLGDIVDMWRSDSLNCRFAEKCVRTS